MGKYTYRKISIKPDTFEIFLKCQNEFKKHNPQFDGAFVSQNLLMKQICKYYLEND